MAEGKVFKHNRLVLEEEINTAQSMPNMSIVFRILIMLKITSLVRSRSWICSMMEEIRYYSLLFCNLTPHLSMSLQRFSANSCLGKRHFTSIWSFLAILHFTCLHLEYGLGRVFLVLASQVAQSRRPILRRGRPHSQDPPHNVGPPSHPQPVANRREAQ